MVDIKSIYKKEFDLYDDVFKIKYGSDGFPYSKVVPTGDMVKIVLNSLNEIWNNISLYNEAIRRECDDNLSCLVLASKAPHITIPNISRNALFSERILLPHPMLHFQTLRGPEGPYTRPEIWGEEVMKSALYICALRDWIADDFLRLIPLPSLYSNNLKQRIESTHLSNRKREELEEKVKVLCNDNRVTVELLSEMDDEFRDFLLRKMKKEDIKKYNKIAVELEKEPKYPEWLKINGGNKSTGSIWHTGVGLSPIEVKYLANNWNVYLNPLSKIQKVSLMEEIKSKYNVVNNFIEGIDIKFPKNVPLKYIYDCRKSGVLNSFRNYMLEQYEKIRVVSDEDEIGIIQEEFNKTINSQIDMLNAELKDFYKNLTKDFLDFGTSNIGLGYELISKNISVSSLLNFTGGVFGKAVPKIKKYKALRKNPLIVLHQIVR